MNNPVELSKEENILLLGKKGFLGHISPNHSKLKSTMCSKAYLLHLSQSVKMDLNKMSLTMQKTTKTLKSETQKFRIDM